MAIYADPRFEEKPQAPPKEASELWLWIAIAALVFALLVESWQINLNAGERATWVSANNELRTAVEETKARNSQAVLLNGQLATLIERAGELLEHAESY